MMNGENQIPTSCILAPHSEHGLHTPTHKIDKGKDNTNILFKYNTELAWWRTPIIQLMEVEARRPVTAMYVSWNPACAVYYETLWEERDGMRKTGKEGKGKIVQWN